MIYSLNDTKEYALFTHVHIILKIIMNTAHKNTNYIYISE